MKMNSDELGTFRKRLKFVIPKMKKSDIANSFEKEIIARGTVYANTERLKSLSKKWTTDLLDSY
jgi:hypothetical protein